jgi:hypothetical protein
MAYLWSSLAFLQSFPTTRGGGGVKFFEVDGYLFGATHVTNTFEQKPAFSDVEFIVFGNPGYIVSLDFPGVVHILQKKQTCQDFYRLMYQKWVAKLNPPLSDILPENVSFSQDDVLNFFRRLGCVV